MTTPLGAKQRLLLDLVRGDLHRGDRAPRTDRHECDDRDDGGHGGDGECTGTGTGTDRGRAGDSRGHGGADLVMSLLTAARRIDAACAELLARHDLSEGRLAALLTVAQSPGITPGALAARIEVTRGTVTGLLEGLERRGLVRRRDNPGDARSLNLDPTPAGERLLAELAPVYAGWLDGLVGELSAADTEAAGRGLDAIHRALDAGDRP